MEDYVDLYVELCSDGKLLAFDRDRALSTYFTDLVSWSKLIEIYNCTQMDSKQRKGRGVLNIKHVKYYFKNTQTGDLLEIPPEHIRLLMTVILH